MSYIDPKDRNVMIYEIWDNCLLNSTGDKLKYVKKCNFNWIQFKKSKLRQWIIENTRNEHYKDNLVLFIKLLKRIDKKRNRKFIKLLYSDIQKYQEKNLFMKKKAFKIIIY
jgi:hypothetical protein